MPGDPLAAQVMVIAPEPVPDLGRPLAAAR